METELPDDIFLTVDESGNPVDRRITSPYAVRSIFSKFQSEDSEESGRRTRLLNMYNLNLPHAPDKLAKLGLGNLANFNTGDLKGFIDGRVSAIAKLALDTCPLVELRPHPAGLAGPQAAHFAEVIADEFSTTVRDANKLLPCLAGMFRECDLFGLGPVTWNSPREYNPISIRRGQIKFRADGPITSSDHEVFMFESNVTVGYFSRLFTKAKAAGSEGWNISAVKRYLVEVFISEKPVETKAGDKTGTSPAESAIIEMRQNRWTETNQFKSINLLHSLVKEANGKIRHSICTPIAGVEEFLFDKADMYESFDECLLWMPASVVEQEARGSRGVASIVAPIADINNRLTCQMYDLAFRGGSITLVSQSPGQQHQQSIIERGPYTVLPGDLDVSPTQFNMGAIAQIAQMRDLGNNISYNNSTGARGGLGANSERIASGTERRTKEEIEITEQNRADGELTLFAARVLVLDKIFREVFRRFFLLVVKSDADLTDHPEIKMFKQRCLLQGVPEEALKNAKDLFGIYTNRVLVTGGGAAHANVLGQLLGNFGGNFDEFGRNLMARDMVRYKLGAKCADRYRPESSRDREPSNAASFATIENGSMMRGDPVMVGPDQLHWTHVPVHMQVLGSIADRYKQDPQGIQDPQQLLNIMLGASQHIQEHVNLGSRQPGMGALAKGIISQIASLSPVVKGLTMMAGTMERQRRAAAEKQQREQEELRKRAEGNETAVAMHDIDVKAGLKAREQDLMHDVHLKEVDQKREVELAKAGAQARGDIARQTSRIEQGASILGRGDSAPLPVMEDPVGF